MVAPKYSPTVMTIPPLLQMSSIVLANATIHRRQQGDFFTLTSNFDGRC
jgi:hypothetical protein